MQSNRALLEDQLENYEEELKEVNSYAAELKATTARLGTDPEQFAQDLIENNIKYYEGEIALIKKALGTTPKPTPSPGPIPSQPPKPGIGSIIASSISFIVGALLGSKLRARKDR
jgi:hypothetical protein